MFSFRKKNNLAKLLIKNKTIVCIGGGTGLYSLLSGLKKFAADKNCIKAIVTTMDSGGSSGKLRTQFGVLPPGDIRNCLVALSEETQVLNELFQYRFDEKVNDHNIGNLLLTALAQITGSFESAVKEASRILRVKGEVIPVSLEKNDIIAEIENGNDLIGETIIDTTPNKKITKLKLKDKTVPNKRAIEVIKKADLIIFGPGDLYTSILPNLLFHEIREVIKHNRNAKKILISSIMSKPGETDDFKVSDFKKEIEKYLGSNITHIVSNSQIPALVSLEEYRAENKHPILLDEKNIFNCKIIKGNFIDENKLLRHDSKKLAKAILSLL
ncbi:MAG: YvcK family protein [Nanoarchaeota archaeon]|nr:YvcK family protein [Nanoarchaeota archaeon]